MLDMEKIRTWLLSWPGWEAGAKLHVDYLDTVPGNCALFPGGMEEVSRKSDLLGNTRVHCRCKFILYRVTDRKENGQTDALWLHNLTQWVQQQSIAGLAPTFGEEPASETIRTEKGRLTKSRQPGNGMYAVEFTVEFIKIYEVI